MKNYSIDKEKSKKFILDYRIKNNQIFIKFASNKKKVISYTLENKEKVEKLMKKQVINAEKQFESLKNHLGDTANIHVIENTLLIIVNLFCCMQPGAYTLLLIFFFSAISCVVFIKRLQNKLKLDDLYKNIIFVQNEKILNEEIQKENNILFDINRKTRKLIFSTPKNKPVFTFQLINKIKYKELQKIIENIKFQKGLDLSDPFGQIDSNPYVLNYKIKNNKIILKTSKGKKVFPYTLENKEKVASFLQHQILDQNTLKRLKDSFLISNISSFFGAFYLFWIILPHILPSSLGFGSSIWSIISGFLILPYSINFAQLIRSKLKLDDARKYVLFAENKTKLNANIETNQKFLSDTNKKEINSEVCFFEPDNESLSTSLSIEKIKYKELKKILESLKLKEELEFDNSEEKDKILVLGKRNKLL